MFKLWQYENTITLNSSLNIDGYPFVILLKTWKVDFRNKWDLLFRADSKYSLELAFSYIRM